MGSTNMGLQVKSLHITGPHQPVEVGGIKYFLRFQMISHNKKSHVSFNLSLKGL